MRRRYHNDPETRDFFERLDALTWWESVICVAVFVFVFLPAALVVWLTGWRMSDD